MLGLSKVFLMVEDQERAKKFWVEKIGCEIAEETPYEGPAGTASWIELRTPDKGMILALIPLLGQPQAVAPDGLPASNLYFTCDNFQETYNELRERGVEFVDEPVQQPWGWWTMFKDPEGMRFTLGERQP
jgi:predicted enzyme related to lactoylglutathione lyase